MGDQINKPGLRFLPELSLSGLAEVVYFDLRLYFLHDYVMNYLYVSSIIEFLEVCCWIALPQKQKQKRAIKVVFHALLNNYISYI